VRVRDTRSVLDEERVAGALRLLSPSDRAAALHGLSLLAHTSSQYMRLESPRRAG
jgi:hypothetical protein